VRHTRHRGTTAVLAVWRIRGSLAPLRASAGRAFPESGRSVSPLSHAEEPRGQHSHSVKGHVEGSQAVPMIAGQWWGCMPKPPKISSRSRTTSRALERTLSSCSWLIDQCRKTPVALFRYATPFRQGFPYVSPCAAGTIV